MQTNQPTNTRKLNSQRNLRLLFAAPALLLAVAQVHAQNGTWTNLVSGNGGGSWTNSLNWLGSTVASGADNTANFSTLDITVGSTVTLDGARTIGNLTFADTNPSTNWTVNASSTNATLPAASALTLAVSSGTPTITVTNQITTFNASVFGTNGLTKSGVGTLRLNGVGTNSSGSLGNLITVLQGDLQIGNALAPGVSGNQNGTNRVIVTNGATLEVIAGVAPNNKHLTISGTGVGGTLGAIYANPATNSTSTRWGLSTVSDAGASANSSASFPAVTLADNSTIRVDGSNTTYSFLIGYVTSGTNNFTLTKAGTGRLSFERGANVSNIVVQAGSISPNSASGFNAVQTWTINSGGTIYNNQNHCYSATASMTVNAGGVWDINGRTDQAGTGYTEDIGFLTGTGTITHGSLGTLVSTILAVDNNSTFNGPIQVANGTLNLTKNTTNTTLQLNGTNTYNGTTTVNAGTLLVDGIHNGGSNYVVAAGATLGGKGSILLNSGNTITLGGFLVAGDGGGTLTVSNVVSAGGDLTIVSNANLTVNGQLGTSGAFLGAMYLTNATLQLPLQVSGASAFVTSLTNDGNVTLRYTSPNPAVGQFPLIAYSSLTGLAGGGTNGFTLVPPAGTTAFLSNNVGSSTLDVVVTAIPALVWRGTPTGDWSIGGSANWLNGATPAAYTETAGQGPFVIFDDTAAGTSTVNLTTTVTPKGITVNNTNKSYSFTGSGVIAGNGSLEKDGTNTLMFANTSANTYSGTITINAGALSIGSGGAAGNIGSASVANSGSVIFNRSDAVTVANSISGTGSLVNQGTGSTTLTGVGNVGGAVTVNAGTLALGPAGTITVSGDVTGNGAFGVNGPGTVKVSSSTVTYSGGTVITNGTLELDNAFPPSGNISDNGTLALGVGGTLANNISGPGGLSLLAGASVTLGGANTYAGQTVVLAGSTVNAAAANYPSGSALVLGSQSGANDIGNASFTSGNPVLGGLKAGGNSATPVNTISMGGSGQTLTVNGNMSVGNVGPIGASVGLTLSGSAASLVINTNGGTIQLGLGATSSGVNPDNVLVDLSSMDNFTALLGTSGVFNMGTLDGNPGPPNGATVVNQFKFANVSNYVSAGSLVIGAGGRQLIPELDLGAGTNILNVNTLSVGGGGRDGGKLVFGGGTGGVRVRANDGVSRATMNVGVNPATGTGASITNTVDLSGHPADLLLGSLTIGDYNNAGVYQCSFTFDTGTLNATSTSLSALRNNNANASASLSTLTINGGVASLGPVSLTASAAPGTLNIANATVTVSNITATGSGLSTFSIGTSTLNLYLTNNGNPVTAPITANSFSASGTVNLAIRGTNWLVGQFPLISYTGSIGGSGFSALNLTSLPTGVTASLSNNTANSSVDLVVTAAPPVVSTIPVPIVFNSVGNTLNLSWPPDHKGWTLLTNATSITNSAAWFAYPGSSSVTNVAINVDPTKTNVFFRLRYP